MAFKGADAKMSVVIGAMAVSDLVKSTPRPQGHGTQTNPETLPYCSTLAHAFDTLIMMAIMSILIIHGASLELAVPACCNS